LRFNTFVRIKAIGNHRLLLFFFILVGIGIVPLSSFAQEVDPGHHYGLGPFQIRSQSPAHSLRLSMPPMVPGKIIPGRFTLWLGGNWTNTFADQKNYLLDYEMADLNAVVGYGITPRLFVSLGYDRRHYFGGAMDGLIREWHDLLNIDQQGRNDVPRDQARIIFYDDDENITADITDIDRLESTGISLSTQYILHHGTDLWPAISLSGILRYGINTPDGKDNDEPIDFGVSLGLSKKWAKHWYTYFSTGLTYYGQNEYLGLLLEESILSATLGIQWRFRPDISIIAQHLVNEGAVENFGKLSNPSVEGVFGFKWQAKNLGVVEFGIIENISTHVNGPDFGWHLGYTYPF